MPNQPSRRTLLLGSLAGVLSLGGCGVRLEDDAPDIPFVPERKPLAGEAAMLTVLGHLRSQGSREWTEQADALRSALADAGVPKTELRDAPDPETMSEAVTAYEAAVRDCGLGMLPLMGRLTASQIRRTPDLFDKAPSRGWRAGAVAADDLKATRAATYALGVIAARSSKKVSRRAKDARKALQELSVRQTTAAGKAAGKLTLGYDLDREVSGEQAARQFGRQSLERLVDAYTAGLYRLDKDRAAALETASWMATAQGLAEDWGSEPVALIGADAK